MIASNTAMAQKDIYLPVPATVVDRKRLTAWETYFKFKVEGEEDLHYLPGQFMEVSLPGIGECPISITSSPSRSAGDRLEMVVRDAGSVTHALHQLAPGDRLGMRGPFGTSFPVADRMKAKDLLFICGGLGLVPVKSAIDYVLDDRYAYGNITILIGNRAPENRLFLDDMLDWKRREDVTCLETVDVADPHWGGNVGVITTLLPRVQVDSPDTICIICGPPIMYTFVLRAIAGLNLKKENVLLSLERHMKCGVGKCGHCQINGIYACQSGPVVTYKDVLTLEEGI